MKEFLLSIDILVYCLNDNIRLGDTGTINIRYEPVKGSFDQMRSPEFLLKQRGCTFYGSCQDSMAIVLDGDLETFKGTPCCNVTTHDACTYDMNMLWCKVFVCRKGFKHLLQLKDPDQVLCCGRTYQL